MTWVIGGSTLFGYGVMLSDIRVSHKATGQAWDALQKAFPLGRFIAGGLAGDVGAGLSMLRSLQTFLSDNPIRPDECWEPEFVAETWSKEAERTYERMASNGFRGDIHIMTVGVAPRPKTKLMGGDSFDRHLRR